MIVAYQRIIPVETLKIQFLSLIYKKTEVFIHFLKKDKKRTKIEKG